ncbi:bifunctional hemolysin/adenylate cyclase [Antarctobacter heliothermus]|uniref:Bifunctional hemolysin/adenylate cyclase n=1 Tax=Antarctobacter heliothermus TaxID=74033 RepID=A0A222E7S9_9RHOB|nr:Hint domain-containing protein [Antarctobacter heliothermus]ASP22263.1 bifunctional hemolysin/adenylate cyclase [Antarctobacter heliothermus]
MADLVLEWGALGPFGTNLADADGGVSASVDTGGVAVDISYDGLSAGSSAFTFNAPGYVAPDETFSNQSFLKLFGEGTGAASDTSTTVLDFRATDTSLYSDAAQNVSFRINDIDTGVGGDFAEAGGGFQDVVNVTALDPDGNPVPVTLTLGSGVTNAGGDLTGTPETGFEDATTSVLVEITGPVASIQIEYANGAVSQQGVTITDIEFSTVDVDNGPPDAVDDTATTTVGEPVTLDPRDNDTDPDGDPLTVTGVTPATNGTAVLNGDGTVTYTPNPGYTGTDTFTYTITDGIDTDEATVTVEVTDDAEPRIDTDVFPVAPGDQLLDPLNGLDQDPDPLDDLDSIVGDGTDELIETGDDADTILAGGGNDTVNPGIDNDYVELGGGDDSLFDVQGADTIFGGSGNDTIIAGTDTFSDYEGDDPSFAPGTPLNGLGFTSDPNTEDGRDYVEGNLGDDSIATGDDADTIDGGGGNDTLDGGIDDDSIMGGQGDDLLIGSHGSDTLDGGQGNDTLDGSNFASLELTDDIDPNTENDRDLLQGFLGDDSLIGGDDDDTLQGGSGNDTLDGGIDDDILMGGNDNDVLIGGQGNDTLNGGSGVDSISGGSDRDVIIVDSAADGIGDTVDGGSGGFVDQTNPEDPPNQDYDILDLSGVGAEGVDWRLVNEVADSNGNGLDGTIEFLDGSGAVTGTMDFFEIEEIVPCFTPGTLIATPQGERLVEDLAVGDRVITRDNGIQEIKWVGRKDLTGFDLARKPHFKPILIQQGALGNNLPEHDMLVSPNHRVLVANDKTALYFEEREVLVAAKHLTSLDGVDEVEANGVAYIHVMFEGHEVILSNGAWTESFQPGDYSLKGIGNAQRQEILELFPELEHAEGLKAYASARRSLKKHEAALLTK